MRLLPFLLLLSLVLGGCSLFAPRDSDAPTQVSNRSYTRYDDIMREIESIYSTGNTPSLSLILADDFFFDGDSLDSIALQSPNRTWGSSLENQITIRMLSDTTKRIIRFGPTYTPLSDMGDSVLLRWEYDLERRDSVHIEGTSDFALRRVDGRYYLCRWTDRIRTTGPAIKSWGKWKMENN